MNPYSDDPYLDHLEARVDHLMAENRRLGEENERLLADQKSNDLFQVYEDRRMLREKIMQADVLLGPWGGSAADTIAALHNLIAERVMLHATLAELVELKDGPRDSDYTFRKPWAWAAARDALKKTQRQAISDEDDD